MWHLITRCNDALLVCGISLHLFLPISSAPTLVELLILGRLCWNKRDLVWLLPPIMHFSFGRNAARDRVIIENTTFAKLLLFVQAVALLLPPLNVLQNWLRRLNQVLHWLALVDRSLLWPMLTFLSPLLSWVLGYSWRLQSKRACRTPSLESVCCSTLLALDHLAQLHIVL